MYSIAYFVDTVSEMSTKVDHALTHISITVETVSGMSTGVDLMMPLWLKMLKL